jgi:zinc protease
MWSVSLPRLAALGLVVLGLVTPSVAQDDVFDIQLEQVTATTLDNGLEVIVIEDHSMPLVTIEIAVRSGAFVEPPELNGLSHLYEHMFFKGNEAIPTQQAYMARQRELGMDWNGTTSEERVNYFFTLGSDKLCEGMVFMSNAIRTPLFDRTELERERQVVLGEFDRNEASPYYHLFKAVQDALWYAHPSRKDPLGDRPTIGSATVEQMRWLQQTYYVPNNAALLLAGDVTPEQGFALAQEIFGSWERGPAPFAQHPPVVHPPLAHSQGVVVEQDVQAVTIQVAWHGPSVADDPQATFAADVFSFIVSQSAHEFQRNLVDTGLVLGVDLSYYTQRNTGPIALTLQAAPQNVEAALRAVYAEVDHFRDADYFTDEQLETAKTLLAVTEIYGRERTSSWVHVVSFWWAVAGLDYYRDYVRNLQAVTRDDIDRYLATYLERRPFVIGAVASPSARSALGLEPEQLVRWFGP